jgi:hypothetical protein
LKSLRAKRDFTLLSRIWDSANIRQAGALRQIGLEKSNNPRDFIMPHRNARRGRQKHPLLSSQDVIALLRAEIDKVGTESEWARQSGANRSSVNLALKGRVGIQKNLLDALGLEMVVAYAPRRR